MFRAFWGMLSRDCMIYIRYPAESLASLGFFSLIMSLFLILFGFVPTLLSQIGPALIWTVVLLSIFMTIEVIVRSDYQSGALEQLLLSRHPLAILCLAKMLAHVVVMGVPLVIIAPFVGVLFHLNTAIMLALFLSLCLGIPSITFIASVGATLTLGLDRGVWLVMLLMVPLLLPILLLGSHAVICASQHLSYKGDLLLLGALCVLTFVFMPLLMAFSLRVSLE